MAVFADKLEMHVVIKFRISFWEAIKIRIAGKGADELIKALAEKIIQDDAEQA